MSSRNVLFLHRILPFKTLQSLYNQMLERARSRGTLESTQLKVVLMGRSNAGKTSLLHRFLNRPDMPESDDRTVLVEMSRTLAAVGAQMGSSLPDGEIHWSRMMGSVRIHKHRRRSPSPPRLMSDFAGPVSTASPTTAPTTPFGLHVGRPLASLPADRSTRIDSALTTACIEPGTVIQFFDFAGK